MTRPRPSPRDLGFRMPVERGPHAATWTSWPQDDDLWDGRLEAVRDEVAALVAAIARFEPVVVNVEPLAVALDMLVKVMQSNTDSQKSAAE